MDSQILKHLGQVAGIGGLSLGVFLLITKEIIRKVSFPKLTKSQSSRLILAIMLMAWTTAVIGMGMWAYISTKPPIPHPDISRFPANKEDKQYVREALYYLQVELSLMNSVYSVFYRALDQADQFEKSPSNFEYESLKDRILFSKREINEVLDQNHPLSQELRTKLINTPLSVANLAILYDHVTLEVRESSQRLDSLVKMLDPKNPLEFFDKRKWLSTLRDSIRIKSMWVSYGVCELLLPIDRSALKEFRKDFLPNLTAFQGEFFNFSLDETQLIQLQNTAERKLQENGNELSQIVGNLKLDASYIKDYFKREIEKKQQLNK